MNDFNKTKQQLIAELQDLRKQLAQAATIQEDLGDFHSNSEKRLIAFANALPDRTLIFDHNGRYINILKETLSSSSAALQLNNRKGSFLHDVLPGDIADYYVGIIRQAIKSRTIQIIEFEVVDDDARTLVMEGRAAPFEDPVTGEWQAIWLTRDVTGRRNMEDALKNSEQHYRTLFDSIDDAIFIHDEQANILDVNAAACRRLGYTREELLVMKTTDVDAPEYAAGFQERMDVQRAEGKMSTIGGVHVTKDGQRIDIDVNTTLIDYKGQSAVLAVVRDITAYKQAEAAVRLNEQRYRELFYSSPTALFEEDFSEVKIYLTALKNSGVSDFVAYFTENPDEVAICAGNIQIVRANQAACKLYGAEKETDLLGALKDLFSENSLISFHDQLCALGEGALTFVSETSNRSLTGKLFQCQIGLAIQPLHQEHWDRVLVSVFDLTERNQAEADRLENEKLRGALEKEQELADLRNQFMSMISHELRTPLATALLSADILALHSDKLSAQQQEKKVLNIRRQLEQLDSVIDRLGLGMRAERGYLDLQPSVVDLVVICQQVIQLFQESVAEMHTIQFDHKGQFNRVWLDGTLITHVLTNLISNAIKYSPDGGLIQLDLTRDEQTLVIRVSDEGIGIPEVDQQQLFGSFYRAANVGAIRGTGLGLSIVKAIVELHGGDIRFESVVGAGTVFILTIPIHENFVS